MAETSDPMRDVMANWSARIVAQKAAFSEIRFGEDGYFQRAVKAVTPMLESALWAKPSGDQIGRAFLEVLPTLLRSEETQRTNESFEQLITKSETDFRSFQELEYHALNPINLRQYPALADWQRKVFLGAAKPPARRGQHPNVNFSRDSAICTAIKRLKSLGFKAYRNKASPNISACDVVAEALGKCGQSLSYDGVARIWENQDTVKAGAGGKDLAEGLAEQLLAFLSETKRT
ncbi:hypothetical protein [Paracoccus rhizosphaerae]|uniref:Uncharacterized protein n=1 Tax=Paracoccus rhizosphaerae TaxID=1133347 RepID=A0ABV6CLP9_9RHOB|nr:hypothetical protein [Paracoccus rhizosphaerae]